MRTDLLQSWENSLQVRENDPDRVHLHQTTVDDEFMQTSFEFTKKVSVVFVKSRTTLEAVKTYNELPILPLNKEEKEALKEQVIALKKSSNPHDGDHLLISAVIYDNEADIIFLEAYKAKYSFLSALEKRKFPEESKLYQMPLYETGVLCPFITKDDYTFLMERNDRHRLYCAAAGFIQPIGKRKILDTTSMAGHDLIVHTAIKEVLEEFFGVDNNINESRLSFRRPVISSLSFYKRKNGVGNADFIAPMQLNCGKDTLAQVLGTNEARDRHEHTGIFHPVPLNAQDRHNAKEFLDLRKPGRFLYEPMLMSSSRFVNGQDFIPTRFPSSNTLALPADALEQCIQRPLLTWHWNSQKNVENNRGQAELPDCSKHQKENKGPEIASKKV